jgi:hypothetical protein
LYCSFELGQAAIQPAILHSSTVWANHYPALNHSVDQPMMQADDTFFTDHDHNASMQQVPGLTPRQPLTGNSCCLMGPTNWLRLPLSKLLSHPYFEHAILLLIFASSITLALDMPNLDPSGQFKQALEVLDCIFAVLFLAEAVLKILVHGLVFNGPTSYLRNPWNVLDFLIVVVGEWWLACTYSKPASCLQLCMHRLHKSNVRLEACLP